MIFVEFFHTYPFVTPVKPQFIQNTAGIVTDCGLRRNDESTASENEAMGADFAPAALTCGRSSTSHHSTH